MKPPKTAALWTQLERLGWRHDSLPVATIMASYESMEKELASERALADMLKDTLEHVHDWHYAKPAYDAWVAARTK